MFIFFLTFSEKQAAISESICIFALIKKQMVLEKNITIKQAVWEKLGEVYPVAQLGDMRLPFFDVDIVAGFPIPLDNDDPSARQLDDRRWHLRWRHHHRG